MNVQSRAHRILKKLRNYKDLSEGNTEIPEDVAINKFDKAGLIGLYINDNYNRSVIIITKKSMVLYFFKDKSYKTIKYEDIQKVELPNDKEIVDKIIIHKKDEAILELPVKGGEGRFSDVFAFYRFLSRVLDDLKV